MARPKTGTLILKKKGYVARYWTIRDGEEVRVTKPLGTFDRAAAKAKLRRLIGKGTETTPEESARPETYNEAFARINEQRVEDGVADAKNEAGRHKLHVAPIIGGFLVTEIKFAHVKAVLATAKDKKLTKSTLVHIRASMHTVFDVLWRDGTVGENPVLRVKAPEAKVKIDNRERAVLTDAELVQYLGWEHPEEKHQGAVRERQTMSCVARMFGGLRTGDLHALRWEALDPDRFEVGTAPRKKTASPQRLIIPAMLRPILRDWWERAGRPMTGLAFPVRRGDNAGKTERVKSSHAKAFRRDLRRVFGVDEWFWHENQDGTQAEHGEWKTVRPLTSREAELLDGTPTVRPVDFHSWRRAFSQALANAGVNAQEGKALAGHATMAAHERYLENTRTARAVPDAALPQLTVGLLAGTIQSEPANETARIKWAGGVSNPGHPACKDGIQQESRCIEGVEAPAKDAGFSGLPPWFSHDAGLIAEASEAALDAYLRTRAYQIAGAMGGAS